MNSTNQDGSNLILHHVYPAIYVGLSSNVDTIDEKFNPRVRIFTTPGMDEDEPYHFGYVVFSTYWNLEERIKSNKIREGLIENMYDTGIVYVKVLALPSKGDFRGPYTVVATRMATSTIHGSLYEMTQEEAYSVVISESIFYGRCLYKREDGTPVIRIYDTNGTKSFGFLNPTKRNSTSISPDSLKNYSDLKLTKEIINDLNPGEYLLVRKVGTANDTPAMLLEPAINILKSDNAKIGDSQDLIFTCITGYEHGGLIANLPITSVTESKELGMVGVGYVQKPDNPKKEFYYEIYHRTVKVKDAEFDKGKFIRLAVVRHNFGSVILADKIM